MSGAQKFLFEHSFDELDLEAVQEAIRKEAFEAGRFTGIQEANASNSTLARVILEQMDALKDLELQRLQKMDEDVAIVARVIFEAVFPIALENHGFDEVLESIKKTFIDLSQNNISKAAIYVAPDCVDSLSVAIKEVTSDIQVTITADPAYGMGDCRIDWEKSGIERISQHIYEQVMLALARSGASHVNIDHNQSIEKDAALEGNPQEEQEQGSET